MPSQLTQTKVLNKENILIHVESELTLKIYGNVLEALPFAPFAGDSSRKTEVPTYSNPFYETFEGFCRNAGESLRVGMFSVNDSERVIAIYDSRRPFYPSLDDVMEEKREETARRIADQDELTDADGRMVEWQQGGNFGYFWNLDCDFCSEWGYATMYPISDETQQEATTRSRDSFRRLLDAIGGDEEVFVISAPSHEDIVIKGESL